MPVVDETNIIAHVYADLARGTVQPVQVECTQYDAEMRVIAVHLRENNRDWSIPSGYAVNVRMKKQDGTSVYNPQQGEGNIAYITLSAQMCGVAGTQYFVVEIVKGDDVVQTIPIRLNVRQNPIDDTTFTSSDEYKTIQGLVEEAQDAAEESQENANQAYTWAQNTLTLYHQTEDLVQRVEEIAQKIFGVDIKVEMVNQSQYDDLTHPNPKTIYIVCSDDNPIPYLKAYYPLTSDVADMLSGRTGSIVGGGSFADGALRTAPAGTVSQHQNYIQLPENMFEGLELSDYDGITIALDVMPDTTCAAGNGDWTRLLQFYKPANTPEGTAEGDVYLTQGCIGTAYYNGSTTQALDATVASSITAGEWHTVVMTVSGFGVVVNVYVDGDLVVTGQDGQKGIISQMPNFTQNYIGNSRFSDNDFVGLVRNLRVYNKALTSTEIGSIGSAPSWTIYFGGAKMDDLVKLQEALDTLTESVSNAQDDLTSLRSDVDKIKDGTTNLPYLKTSGGTMAGNVDMDGNALTGLPDPAEDSDAVPKGWADGQYSPLTAAIRPTVTGNPITVTDSAEAPVQGLCVYGKTTQDGTPSTENPVPLVSAEDVSVTLSDGGDGSQTLTLTGDLPGIPVDSGGNYTDPDGQQWVCNYRDWARGVDVQMVAQETLSGTPAFKETSDIPGRFSWNNALSNTYKDGGSKSLLNFAQWVPWSNPGTNTRGATNVKHVLFSPAETMTEEEVNAIFVTMIASDAPPTVIGQLETPIETPIPAEELAAYKELQTYDGTTNATATDGAGLSLRYVADTQKYIDNKIAAISAAMLEG